MNRNLSGYVIRGRYIQENKVPFDELLPLKLKNKVSGKSERNSTVACIQEMSVMFACLKRNDFTENFCPNEITSFQKCCDENAKRKYETKEKEKKGILTPGERSLSHKQIAQLLKQYPA